MVGMGSPDQKKRLAYLWVFSPGIVLASFWARFGVVSTTFWGCFWTILGPFGPFLGHFYGHFAVFWVMFCEVDWKIKQNDAREGKNMPNSANIHQKYAKLCKNKLFFQLSNTCVYFFDIVKPLWWCHRPQSWCICRRPGKRKAIECIRLPRRLFWAFSSSRECRLSILFSKKKKGPK